MHCKSVEQIVAEANELANDGAVELNLIGQDTTSYGRDIEYEPGLAGLLRALNDIEALRWIRLLYVYPTDLTDEILRTIADCERIVNYIDIPLQHISDRILKAMHRRIDKRETVALLERIRQLIPGVAIRTTLIAGFPGESDAEFEEMLEFVEDAQFDALGVFPYSNEPDTPSGRMVDQVPVEIKQERADELMAVQQEVAFELARQRVGREFEVLIEDTPRDGAQPARHA